MLVFDFSEIFLLFFLPARGGRNENLLSNAIFVKITDWILMSQECRECLTNEGILNQTLDTRQ